MATGELFNPSQRDVVPDSYESDDGARRYFPDRRVLVELFPSDRTLPGLVNAASVSWVSDAFQRLQCQELNKNRIAHARPQSYKPRLRCTFEYVLDPGNTTNRFFGKTVPDERGEVIHNASRIVFDSLSATDEYWSVPKPRGYLPGALLMIHDALENGKELSRIFNRALRKNKQAPLLLRSVERAADGLAPFRHLSAPGLRYADPQKVMERLVRSTEDGGLERVVPHLGREILARVRTLQETAATLPAENMRFSHGAFRLGQFMVQGEQLIVLDLDTVSYASPSADPAEFLTALDRIAIHTPNARALVEQCERTFRAALQKQADIRPEWLAWHRAASHVKAASRAFFSLGQSWRESANTHLVFADLVLNRPEDIIAPELDANLSGIPVRWASKPYEPFAPA